MGPLLLLETFLRNPRICKLLSLVVRKDALRLVFLTVSGSVGQLFQSVMQLFGPGLAQMRCTSARKWQTPVVTVQLI
jgi:hypothetical protein